MNEIYNRLNAVFREVFDDESITVSENTTAADIEDWDSLTHIQLIAAVEDEFGVKFTMKQVSSMKNVGEMVQIIAERCAEPKSSPTQRIKGAENKPKKRCGITASLFHLPVFFNAVFICTKGNTRYCIARSCYGKSRL